MTEHDDILQVEGINSKGYGIIPKLVMQDKRLSISAKAIYAYFCSYAGAGKQSFPRVTRIVKDLGINRSSYYKHFNQLKDCGYIKTEQKRHNGQLSYNVYTLMTEILCPEIPNTELPCAKLSHTVKSGTVFSYTNKNNSSENQQYYKNNNPPIPPREEAGGVQPSESLAVKTAAGTVLSVGPSTTLAESFRDFWDAYPKQKARNAAEKEWYRLNPSPELVGQILSALELQKKSGQWLKENGQYIPEPKNWLKDNRWKDKPSTAMPQNSSYDSEMINAVLNLDGV